jgi:methionyl-tRNA synthetase
MIEPKRLLVTAALPYANGPIHLGHLAGAYLPADIYVRYQRLKGREVAFLCGSDEHGVPIMLSADKEKVSPQVIVDRYHALNRKAFERFGLSFDNYSRTSLPLHHTTAQVFFLELHRQGVLREKKEKQFFDERAGMFLPDRFVEGTCPVCSFTGARGDQCEKCGSFLNPLDLISPRSKITGETPVVRETTHWYFPLGEYQSRLEAYIKERDARDGWKENVLNYCRGWFKDGLQDRAVTRDLDWGVKIPLPGYDRKVLYVWFDAVLGYISSTKEWAERSGDPEAWKKFWLDETTKYVAFIGKDNVVFHCIVFPAMLMAWNDGHPGERYVLPENVPANEFLNFEGEKFSKSRGWGIDVQEFLEKFPADPLRYYLAVSLPEYRDSDFTWREFQAKNNNELADILGNFVNRTLAFTERTFNGTVPVRGPLGDLDRLMLETLRATPGAAGDHFEQYRFKDGLMEIMNLARAANKYFNDSEPWKSAKEDPGKCGTTISISLQVVRALAVLMAPVIPSTSEKIWTLLNLSGTVHRQHWESSVLTEIPPGRKIGTPQILIQKIEDAVIESELAGLPRQPAAEPAVAAAPMVPEKPNISIEDFARVDLRIARVLSCEPVPKSTKLLKLQVEVGSERRQVVAGVAQHYRPEDLVGKTIVVVFNLQPAKLMGQESQGMLLAASDAAGKLVVLTPAGEIGSGSVVK